MFILQLPLVTSAFDIVFVCQQCVVMEKCFYHTHYMSDIRPRSLCEGVCVPFFGPIIRLTVVAASVASHSFSQPFPPVPWKSQCVPRLAEKYVPSSLSSGLLSRDVPKTPPELARPKISLTRCPKPAKLAPKFVADLL